MNSEYHKNQQEAEVSDSEEEPEYSFAGDTDKEEDFSEHQERDNKTVAVPHLAASLKEDTGTDTPSAVAEDMDSTG